MLITRLRNILNGLLYRQIVKRIFFAFEPDRVHEEMVNTGHHLGKSAIAKALVHSTFGTQNIPELSQTLHGVQFRNPVGLSGGFDKNAILTDIIPAVGFGFMEVGSITAKESLGNPGQHLWRLPRSKSIIVHYGLSNKGAEEIASRLREKIFTIPIGINIAKTNCPETNVVDVGIKDYAKTYKIFADIGDFFVINVSCPNVTGGQPFHNSKNLDLLLTELETTPTTKPMFLKISPDLTHEEIDAIIEVTEKHHIDGFICSNLTKRRNLTSIVEKNLPTVGGLSGKVVEPLANELISYVYTKTRGEKTIIGVGGIFSAEDAYKKIRLGASLVELITGMIYQGPQLISEINIGLAKLLKKDGFSHISEAVGIDQPGSRQRPLPTPQQT